jgi:membrane-associated phospholipid phosphatase
MFLAHWKRAILAHPGPLLALFLGVLVPLWVFGAPAEDVWTHAGFRWDAPILLAIHAHATPALDRLMIGVSTVGGPEGMAVLCVLVLGLLAALALLAWPTRLRWPALILAAGAGALIGSSRLYLGVHYPSDVVAAWTAVLAWVVGLRLILLARAAHRPPLSPPARRQPSRVAQRWPGQ